MRLPLDIACLLFFVSGGLARLARFNATVALVPTAKSGSIKYFTGIPIPSSLGLTAFMAGCAKTGNFVGAKGWAAGLSDVAKTLASHGSDASKIDWTAMRRLGDLPGGTIKLFGEAGGVGEIHLLSFVFLAWAAAMVSKTLKVRSHQRT
jgi:CDP-diacylglycerol--serine O-phosphatidyltransferase